MSTIRRSRTFAGVVVTLNPPLQTRHCLVRRDWNVSFWWKADRPFSGDAGTKAAIVRTALFCKSQVMKLNPAVLYAFIALSSLCGCRRAENVPEVGSRLTRQTVQIVHYGDDGPLARIDGKSGLYDVVFDPDCQGCRLAEEAIQPTSSTDVSLCEFELVVSGDIEKSYRQLNGILKVRRIDRQPNGAAGHDLEKPNRPCERPLSGDAVRKLNV